MTYYKKHDEIAKLPLDIVKECIEYGETCLNQKMPMIAWYGPLGDTMYNKNYILKLDEEGKDKNNTGGVGFYSFPKELFFKIKDFYTEVNHPLIHFNTYLLQVVSGGSYVAPHSDDVGPRQKGMIYMIKSGGSNVKTVWYEIKPELIGTSHVPESKFYLSYNILDKKEEHILEENTWHFMNFEAIHSVENQESVRMAIWGFNLNEGIAHHLPAFAQEHLAMLNQTP
jgi:hypothetical protein